MLGNSNLALPNKDMAYFYDKYFNYFDLCSMWGNVFGDNNIIIRDFDKKKLLNNDVIDDFLSHLGANSLKVKREKNNESFGLQATKLGHLMRNVDLEKVYRRRIIKRLDHRKKSMPSKTDAINFYSKYKKQNEELLKKFNLKSDNKYFFSDDFSSYSSQRQDLWTEDDANIAINAVLQVMKNNLSTNEDADLFRDCAIELEEIDLEKSYKLMSLAYKIRPNGTLIEKKLYDYKKALKIDNA